MAKREYIQVGDLKSEKLKEISLLLSQIDGSIPFTLWRCEPNKKRSPFYRYLVMTIRQEFAFQFSTTNYLSKYETYIIDSQTEEHLEMPLSSNVHVRVKAPKDAPKVHFSYRDGFGELTDIRRAYFSRGIEGLSLMLFGYFQPAF
jgi:hypothetical protein